MYVGRVMAYSKLVVKLALRLLFRLEESHTYTDCGNGTHTVNFELKVTMRQLTIQTLWICFAWTTSTKVVKNGEREC